MTGGVRSTFAQFPRWEESTIGTMHMIHTCTSVFFKARATGGLRKRGSSLYPFYSEFRVEHGGAVCFLCLNDITLFFFTELMYVSCLNT